MKYYLDDDDKYGYPFYIYFYYENAGDIGCIEVYKTGKIYFCDNFPINSGMSIKDINKILKIVKKELRKQKRRTYFKIS